MSRDTEAIEHEVAGYIVHEFLPGEDAGELALDTPLISGGILDSIGTLKLVSFLEDRFGVRFNAYEAGVENLDTLEKIRAIVERKLSA